MRKSTMLAVTLAFVSLWAMLAAGMTAVWLTEEMRVLGMIMLPAAIMASLLVLYFDWRKEFLRRLASDHQDEGRHWQNDYLEKAA